MAKEEKGEMLPLEAKDKASEEGQNEDKVELKPKMSLLNGCTVIVGKSSISKIFYRDA